MFKKNNIKFLFLAIICTLIIRLIAWIFLLSKNIISIYYLNSTKLDRSNKYLWSKRFIDYNYYNEFKTEHISDKKIIFDQINRSNKYIWIRNTSNNINVKTDLDHFGELIDSMKLNQPIILITTDGDRPVPSSYNKNLVNKILSSNKISNWYTQNYDKSIIHPKLKYYPIGLDMHTKKLLNNQSLDPQGELFNKYLSKHSNNNKKNRIFCDSHLSLSHPRRKEMYYILKNNKMIDFLNEKVNHEQIMKKYSEYRFVLSPIGNGLDCHRTWEVFLLGSIVITETSSLDDMYIKNNLPVIILKNFNELNRINCVDSLNALYSKYKYKCSKDNILEKFNPEYWVKQ